jgi:hypothetical protein
VILAIRARGAQGRRGGFHASNSAGAARFLPNRVRMMRGGVAGGCLERLTSSLVALSNSRIAKHRCRTACARFQPAVHRCVIAFSSSGTPIARVALEDFAVFPVREELRIV